MSGMIKILCDFLSGLLAVPINLRQPSELTAVPVLQLSAAVMKVFYFSGVRFLTDDNDS